MNYLKVYFDGASRGNPGQAGVGVVVMDDDNIIAKSYGYVGKKTNNQAEYLAVILALDLISDNPAVKTNKIRLIGDSQLVIKQLKGEYKVKNPKLKELYRQIKKKIESLGMEAEYEHVKREKNKLADALANRAVDENI